MSLLTALVLTTAMSTDVDCSPLPPKHVVPKTHVVHKKVTKLVKPQKRKVHKNRHAKRIVPKSQLCHQPVADTSLDVPFTPDFQIPELVENVIPEVIPEVVPAPFCDCVEPLPSYPVSYAPGGYVVTTSTVQKTPNPTPDHGHRPPSHEVPEPGAVSILLMGIATAMFLRKKNV